MRFRQALAFLAAVFFSASVGFWAGLMDRPAAVPAAPTIKAGSPETQTPEPPASAAASVAPADLPAQLRFADGRTLVSRDLLAGLPIETVNLDRVHVTIGRISDRVLAVTGFRDGNPDGGCLDTAAGAGDPQPQAPASALAAPVWEGDLAVQPVHNQVVTTLLPLSSLLGPRKPGAYRVTIAATGKLGPGDLAAQPQVRWIFDTDLALSSTTAADGLHVSVHSLTSGLPLAGVDVALVARDDEELGRTKTGIIGDALFAPALASGAGPLAPSMAMSYLGDDFAALGLSGAASDLPDGEGNGACLLGELPITSR